MNFKKQLLSYSTVNIINSSIPFLLLPVLTSYLSPTEYGYLSLIQMVLLVTFPLVLLNSQSLIVIDKSKLPVHDYNSLFSAICAISLMSFGILELLVYLFSEAISSSLNISGYLCYIIPVMLLFQVIPTVLPLYFQANKKPLSFGVFKIVLSVLNLSLSIWVVVHLSMGWTGRLGAILLSSIVMTIIGVAFLIKNKILSFNFKWSSFKSAVTFGFPLIPHTIAGILLTTFGRFYIISELGEHNLGIYSVGLQVGMAMSILMMSINQAYAPYLYECLSQENEFRDTKYLVKLTYKLMSLMLAVFIIFSLIVPLVYSVFIDDVYHDAQAISVLVALSFMFQGFYFLVSNFLFHKKKTFIISANTVFSLLISILLNMYLIRHYQLVGAASAMVITYAYLFFSTWYFSKYAYKLPWFTTFNKE